MKKLINFLVNFSREGGKGRQVVLMFNATTTTCMQTDREIGKYLNTK